ncbi:DUF3575 domain-containing protein [Dokdonia sp. PRO95]|uniref:DUF3575 domain-containing protein n=1 Tax=Dokdonia sp. PRO95 TaxID=1239415 RepID=UPI00126023BD|nr:DUF3575 domain-containing protein [Dokdonia sp. PRO95]
MRQLITLSLLLFCTTMFAQEQFEKSNFSELKLNGLSTALGTIDVEFERTINENSSFGTSLFTTFNDSGAAFQYEYDSGITGFYRRYLSKKYASGLFVEGFTMFHSTKILEPYTTPDTDNNLLIGLGVGYKWISKEGIILQANFGMGRNVFETNQDKVSGRAGISIGYRFK